MLSLEDDWALSKWEDAYLDEPDANDSDENEMYLRADDEAEERWFEKLRECDL